MKQELIWWEATAKKEIHGGIVTIATFSVILAVAATIHNIQKNSDKMQKVNEFDTHIASSWSAKCTVWKHGNNRSYIVTSKNIGTPVFLTYDWRSIMIQVDNDTLERINFSALNCKLILNWEAE